MFMFSSYGTKTALPGTPKKDPGFGVKFILFITMGRVFMINFSIFRKNCKIALHYRTKIVVDL